MIEVLTKYGYDGTSYYELGLYLGLSVETLKIIEANHREDVNRCLLECISAWLMEGELKSKEGPSWISLKNALRKLGENAVADGIERDFLEGDGKLRNLK